MTPIPVTPADVDVEEAQRFTASLVIGPTSAKPPTTIYADPLITRLAHLLAERRVAREALQTIKDNAAVCDDFELCKHKSCAANYNAHETALVALRALGG